MTCSLLDTRSHKHTNNTHRQKGATTVHYYSTLLQYCIVQLLFVMVADLVWSPLENLQDLLDILVTYQSPFLGCFLLPSWHLLFIVWWWWWWWGLCVWFTIIWRDYNNNYHHSNSMTSKNKKKIAPHTHKPSHHCHTLLDTWRQTHEKNNKTYEKKSSVFCFEKQFVKYWNLISFLSSSFSTSHSE